MSYLISQPNFKVDKTIPLALIFAIVIHLGAALIWAAQLDARVGRIERDIEHIGNKVEKLVDRSMS